MEIRRSEPLNDGGHGPESQYDPTKDPEAQALASAMRFAWGPSAAEARQAFNELMARHGYSPEEAKRVQSSLNSMRKKQVRDNR